VDFDQELLARLETDGWDEHVAMERKGTLSIGQMLTRDWLAEVAAQVKPDRPLVVGNVNLAVRYQLDVAQALYDASENGLCVIAAGGHVQGQTLLIHGVFPQGGAGSPVFEVVPSPSDEPPLEPTQRIQERLL
jgi:hypothetical protein